MTAAAYAKVNLTLEVLGVRADGYHSLRSVVLPVSLADDLDVFATSDGVVSSDTGYADDLCVRAALELRGALAARGDAASARLGARISVVKRIPAGGGLGGGSADAAATLVALNELWGAGMTRERLSCVAARVGSDVPSLVLGGPVLMEGRGEVVSRLQHLPRPLHLVLASPGVASSTAQVYAACSPRYDDMPSATAAMAAALASGDIGAIAAAEANDLSPVAMKLHPEIAAAADALRAAGARGVMMSGSGSTVFGIVESEREGLRVAGIAESCGLWARCVHSMPA